MIVKKRPREVDKETDSQRPRLGTLTCHVSLETIVGIPLIRDTILHYLTYYDKIFAIYSLVQAGCLTKHEAKDMCSMSGKSTGLDHLTQKEHDTWRAEAVKILHDLHVKISTSDSGDVVRSLLKPYEKILEYMPSTSVAICQSMFRNMNNRKRVEEVLGPVDYCPMYNRSFVERHNVVAALLSDPDRRCSKARCHELFLVSDKDLEHLQCTFQRNVYHISKYPMHLYKLLEVANVAMKKFGGWDGLQAEMRKRDDKAVARHAKLEEKHARNRIARREELLPLLKNEGSKITLTLVRGI